MNSFIRHTLCPILTALIWGTAFVSQSILSDYLPAFAINAARSLLAAVVLITGCVIFKVKAGEKKDVILGGLVCGTTLFLALNLQQFGIGETSAGKSGFVTALYIVLVPIVGSFFHKKTSARVWIAVVIAVVGLYFLCVSEAFSITVGDISLLLCALMFTFQILGVDHFSTKVHSVVLSAAQFLVTGVFSLIASLLLESVQAKDFVPCIGQLLYIALFSNCIAYTLQIVAQKGGNPTVVSLLLSLESVFAVLGGMVILGERMTGRELAGCALMAVAVVIAQLPEKRAQQA